MADKYGIPEGGNNGEWSAKYWKNNKSKMLWTSVYISVGVAGWPSDLRKTATAVVFAESGGHPYIYNTYKKGHFGLFQISRSAWPDFFKGNSEQWTDPVANARQAYKVYKQQGWGAWEGYTNGDYKQYLDADDSGTGLKEDPISGGVEDVVDPISDALTSMDFLKGAWESVTTPAFWMRVGYGVTGVALLVGGLMLIVRSSPAVVGATEKLTSVVPGGAALKGAKAGSTGSAGSAGKAGAAA